MMTRREALQTTTLIAAGALVAGPALSSAHAQAAAAPFVPKALTPAQLESVATLAELIIPTTETPGARAALVDRFVDNIIANTQPADKERFLTGLAWMDTRSTALYGKPFTGATPEQQTELLTKLAAPSGQAAERPNRLDGALAAGIGQAVEGLDVPFRRTRSPRCPSARSAKPMLTSASSGGTESLGISAPSAAPGCSSARSIYKTRTT
jgi:hypothetical protein